MLFSKMTGCFYPEEIGYTSFPKDVIDVPVEDYIMASVRKPGETLDVVDGRVVVIPVQHDVVVASLWGKIKAKREEVKSSGVKVGDKWFHTDDASRIQHMALNMMGASIPANLQWKTMDGAFVTMNQSLAGQVFQAVALLDMQAFAKAEEHRVAMEASSDPASYDFSAGWPASFGG